MRGHGALLFAALLALLPSTPSFTLRPLPPARLADATCSAPLRAAVVAHEAPLPDGARPEGALRRALRRPWRSLVSAVTIASASVLLRPSGPPPALAARTAQTKTATKAIKKAPNSALPTMVLAGGFVYYSFSSARQEDEEETERIKEETEKMERMSKEFTEVDGDVTVDEDLMKSLRSRMKNSTDTNASDSSGGDVAPDDPSMGGGGGGGAPGPSAPSAGGGGAAVLEPPQEGGGAADDEPPLASAEEIARLNKLFGSPDADK